MAKKKKILSKLEHSPKEDDDKPAQKPVVEEHHKKNQTTIRTGFVSFSLCRIAHKKYQTVAATIREGRQTILIGQQ